MTDRSKATTHAEVCWSWGPAHYECAVAEIERLREQLRLSTVDQVNAEAEANDARAEIEALRAERDALAKDAARYAIARRMSPQQWADAWELNHRTGKPFDEIIDDLAPFFDAAVAGRKGGRMIVVEYDGGFEFWRGDETKIAEIRNIVARKLADQVRKDGKTRTDGMWTVRREGRNE
jgi:hypothetical protein